MNIPLMFLSQTVYIIQIVFYVLGIAAFIKYLRGNK